MAGLLIGLVLGVGLFCLWWACWVPAATTRPRSRRLRVLDRLGDDLRQAGYDTVGPRALSVTAIVAGTVTFLLFLAVSSVPAIGACFGAIATWLPMALVRLRARQRRTALRDLWPDAVDNLASGVRAGLALPEALAQLGHRGPEQLRPAFAAFGQDYRTTGRFQDCLDRLKTRLSDPVGDRLVESLRIAREVGGSDLGRLLRTLSTFLREDARTRAELEARQSWTVNAARLAVAAPWIVLAMLCTRPESAAAYGSGVGALVLIGGGSVTLVAYHLMTRLGRLPEEERVLR